MMRPAPASANVRASVRWKARTVSAPRAGEDEQRGAAEDGGARAVDDPGERRAERGVEAGQRPHGDQRRSGDGECAADRGWEGQRRAQRAHRARYEARGLGDPAYAGRLEQEQREHHEVDELRRSGEQLHKQRRDQRSARRPAHRPGGVGHRPASRVQIDERRADRRDRGSGGQALEDASEQQHVEPARRGEQQHHAGLCDESDRQHRPSADVVRQRAEHQQRDEHGHRVDTEDDRDRHRREPPTSLVDGVKRGWRARAGQQRDENRRE